MPLDYAAVSAAFTDLLRNALQSSYLSIREQVIIVRHMTTALAEFATMVRPPLLHALASPSWRPPTNKPACTALSVNLLLLRNEYVILVHAIVTQSSFRPVTSICSLIDNTFCHFISLQLSNSLSDCHIE